MTPTARRAVLRAFRATGLFSLGRHLSRRALPVLTYHHVVEDRPGADAPLSDSVTVAQFRQQLSYLAAHYHILDGAGFCRFLDGQAVLPSNSVLITFDDGYRNNYELAARLLAEFGATALFFITSGFLDDQGGRLWFERVDQLLSAHPETTVQAWIRRRGLPPAVQNRRDLRHWMKRQDRRERDALLAALETDLESSVAAAPRPETAPMTWDHVREMAAAGMTIGAHTDSHQILGVAAPETVHRELTRSRRRIEEETGRPCWSFSYPNGGRDDFGDRDVAAVEAAGFSCAFTQIPGFVSGRSTRYRLPRIPVPTQVDFDSFLSRLTGLHHTVESISPFGSLGRTA